MDRSASSATKRHRLREILVVSIERSLPWVGLDPIDTIRIRVAYRHKSRRSYWNVWN